MADVSYSFVKKINSTQLTTEIQKSPIVTALSYISTEGDNVDIYFKSTLSNTDESILAGLVAAHAPDENFTNAISKENVPLVEMTLRRGRPGADTFTIVSHDYSDRTTWYQNSIQVQGQALANAGDNLEFQAPLGKRHWINIDNPKLTLDFNKVLEKDGSLTTTSLRRLKVYADGMLIPASDYAVDFKNGKVTFANPRTGTVTADFWHNDGVNAENLADFLIKPEAGYTYRISHVEIQVSKNVDFAGEVIQFETWAGGDLANYGNFSQPLFDLGYGRSRASYRGVRDLINWCNNSYPVLPACGELVNDVLCFPFTFLVVPELNYKQKSLIRLCNVKGLEVSAEIATATFYMEKSPV